MSATRITVPQFAAFKSAGQKISMLTAYDYPMAQLIDSAGVESILVGDSMSMVVQGHSSTLPVTLDEIIYHAEMVGRAVQRALVIVDMPFPYTHLGPYKAVEYAGRILKETRCQAVKLEGGAEQADVIHALVSAGIPVMAHVGLRPQSGLLVAQVLGGPAQPNEYTGTGKIEGMQGAVIKATLDDKPWLIKGDARTTIKISGSAEPEYLRPGIIVKVVGEFEIKTGKATEPVKEISIITPDLKSPLGTKQEKDETVKKDEKSKRDAKAAPSTDKPVDPPTVARYTVVGRIASIKDKTIQVGKMQFELAEGVKIPVEVADPRFLTVGDSITAKGVYLREGLLFAQAIEVEMAEPLKAPVAKNAKSAGKRTGVRDLQDLREKRRDLNQKERAK